jgi:hypothetical protein
MDQAHEEAISELMLGMESSQSDAVQQLQKKYDALVARLEAAESSHMAEIESLKHNGTEQQTFHQDLQTRHDRAVAEADAHAQKIKHLQQTIESISQNPDNTATATSELSHLKHALSQIESERDAALASVQDAEDRIESMKSEVVRKHLARVEPLEKENLALTDKIVRLEAIIAAGDRVARAAATLGEKRDIDTLAEEDEEEDEEDEEDEEEESDASAGAPASAPLLQPGFQAEVPRINGGGVPEHDVVATVSFTPSSRIVFVKRWMLIQCSS